MGRASWLGLCPNSLHKVEVWACARGYYAMGLSSGLLRYGFVHILFSTPSTSYGKSRFGKNLV